VTDYCTPSDLYDHGIPRGSVPNPGRVADGASPSTNSITLDVHGFDEGDTVLFRAEAGGSLPAPLLELVEYEAVPLTESTFSVRPAGGGSVIDFDDDYEEDGSRIVVIAPLPVSAAIAWASGLVDEMLVAHAVSLDPVPLTVRAVTAQLAAWKLQSRGGATTKSLLELQQQAQKLLEKWARGVPVKGSATTQRANLAAAAVVAPTTDRRGWHRFGGPGGSC